MASVHLLLAEDERVLQRCRTWEFFNVAEHEILSTLPNMWVFQRCRTWDSINVAEHESFSTLPNMRVFQRCRTWELCSFADDESVFQLCLKPRHVRLHDICAVLLAIPRHAHSSSFATPVGDLITATLFSSIHSNNSPASPVTSGRASV